jgi:hypothetical protein
MIMRRHVSLLAACATVTACLLMPGSAAAQVVWDAPSMMRPGAPAGLSILLLEAHPTDELGVLAAWRSASAPTGLGLRAGLAEDRGGDLAAMFGLDVSGSLGSLDSDLGDPAVMWWTGGGIGIGDELVASFPLGIVVGWTATGDGLTVAPYVGGHATLDVITGPGDDLDIDASVDLGVDLGFDSGFMVRFGASIGDRDALAVGIRLPS